MVWIYTFCVSFFYAHRETWVKWVVVHKGVGSSLNIQPKVSFKLYGLQDSKLFNFSNLIKEY